jgi:hypothetical protein
MADLKQVDSEHLMEGVRRWYTKKGWCVFEIHYRSDPEKRSQEWLAKAVDSMPDLQSFNREFEVDWASTSGLPFYPQFYRKYAEDRSWFIRPQTLPEAGIVYRGFDYGFRKPACIWMHQSSDGRIRVLREFAPENIDVYEFREAVRFLSGQIKLDNKTFSNKHRALEWIERVLPGTTWWTGEQQRNITWINFSGPEANKIWTASAGSENGRNNEQTDAEVFDAGGVPLSIVNQRVATGTYIIRMMMKDGKDGSGPMLVVDPQCVTLIGGLAGGLTFGKGTRAQPLDDDVAPSVTYSHTHDGLRYAVSGIVNVADVQQIMNQHMKPQPEITRRQRVAEPPRRGPETAKPDQGFYASIDENW